MIKILENRKGLQTGGKYFVKTDSGKAVLVHESSKNSTPVSLELLRKVRYEETKDRTPEDINGM